LAAIQTRAPDSHVGLLGAPAARRICGVVVADADHLAEHRVGSDRDVALGPDRAVTADEHAISDHKLAAGSDGKRRPGTDLDVVSDHEPSAASDVAVDIGAEPDALTELRAVGSIPRASTRNGDGANSPESLRTQHQYRTDTTLGEVRHAAGAFPSTALRPRTLLAPFISRSGRAGLARIGPGTGRPDLAGGSLG
jgi:hypothetical protein